MNKFGLKVRDVREGKGLLLRQVAAALEVDTAFLSKIELGKKKASRIQVSRIISYLNVKEEILLPLWLSDRIFDVLENEPHANEALEITKCSIIKNI